MFLASFWYSSVLSIYSDLKMYSQNHALELLLKYLPGNEAEVKSKAFISDFIKTHAEYWSRTTLDGHLTASAWITNRDGSEAVLLHHKKLDLWLQPGGHIDDEDSSLLEAALREAKEETGLKELVAKSTGVFDLDVHKIPSRKSEPEHWHLDIRFWFIAENEELELSDESHDLAWLSKSQIEQKTSEESVLRMVRKTLG